MSHCKHKWEAPESYGYFKEQSPIIKCTVCGKTSFPNKTANAKARLGKRVTNKRALTGFGVCHADLSYSTVAHNKQYHNHNITTEDELTKIQNKC